MTLTRQMHGTTSYITHGGFLAAEAEIAEFAGVSDCVFVSGVREGLRLALMTCGIGEGDAVLCTALGSAVIPAVIRETGAMPIFADINPNTLNIDPYCLEYAIKRHIRDDASPLKALITSDLFGMPCNYRDIMPVCERHGITLIEDMGAACGARDGEIATGQAGRFAVASFLELCPTLGLGEDCAILCRDPDDATFLRSLRGGDEQQSLNGEWGAEEAQGMLICEIVKRAEDDLDRRRKIAKWYIDRLKGHVHIQEALKKDIISAHTQFVILPESSAKRLDVIDALTLGRVPFTIYYPGALSNLAGVRERKAVLINAERAGKRLLALPMHPYLSENVVSYICGCVLNALN